MSPLMAWILIGTAAMVAVIAMMYLYTHDKLDDIHSEVKSLHTRHDNEDEAHRAQERHHSKLYRLIVALWDGDKQKIMDEWKDR